LLLVLLGASDVGVCMVKRPSRRQSRLVHTVFSSVDSQWPEELAEEKGSGTCSVPAVEVARTLTKDGPRPLERHGRTQARLVVQQRMAGPADRRLRSLLASLHAHPSKRAFTQSSSGRLPKAASFHKTTVTMRVVPCNSFLTRGHANALKCAHGLA
jgi:hypothetical protein